MKNIRAPPPINKGQNIIEQFTRNASSKSQKYSVVLIISNYYFSILKLRRLRFEYTVHDKGSEKLVLTHTATDIIIWHSPFEEHFKILMKVRVLIYLGIYWIGTVLEIFE